MSQNKSILKTFVSWSIAVLWIMPFVGIFMASIRPTSELTRGWWNFSSFNPGVKNYFMVLFGDSIPMLQSLWNSSYISLLSTLIPMVLGITAGYAFARDYIPFKKFIIIGLLALMALPLQAIAIPVYKIMNTLGLIDSIWSVVILNAATGLPWIIFFMMNYIRLIPIELEEAATIDGCGAYRCFFYIVLPQTIPAMISVFILQFVFCWTDFFLPLIFLFSSENYTAIQVIPMLKGQFFANWGELAAASVVVILPPFLLFMFLQKYYIRGAVGWISDK